MNYSLDSSPKAGSGHIPVTSRHAGHHCISLGLTFLISGRRHWMNEVLTPFHLQVHYSVTLANKADPLRWFNRMLWERSWALVYVPARAKETSAFALSCPLLRGDTRTPTSQSPLLCSQDYDSILNQHIKLPSITTTSKCQPGWKKPDHSSRSHKGMVCPAPRCYSGVCGSAPERHTRGPYYHRHSRTVVINYCI